MSLLHVYDPAPDYLASPLIEDATLLIFHRLQLPSFLQTLAVQTVVAIITLHLSAKRTRCFMYSRSTTNKFANMPSDGRGIYACTHDVAR